MAISLMIVTGNPEAFARFAKALGDEFGVRVQWASSSSSVLDAAGSNPPDVVVADESVDGESGVGLIRKLLQVNAFIPMAMVSSLPETEFHKITEGLGLLTRLPRNPDLRDAASLMEKLHGVSTH